MPGEYSWYVKGQVIYARVHGIVTVEDLREGNDTISNYLQEAPTEQVHVIYDVTDIDKVAFNVAQVIRSLTYMRRPSLGWVTVFGAKDTLGTIVQYFGSMMMRLVGVRIRMFNTLDEMLNFLKREDSALACFGDEDKPIP